MLVFKLFQCYIAFGFVLGFLPVAMQVVVFLAPAHPCTHICVWFAFIRKLVGQKGNIVCDLLS